LVSATSRAQWRAGLLKIIALACSLGAWFAMLDPDRVATQFGVLLSGVNGYSQFYATYVGVRLATAALALLAARRGDQPILGDITAMFLLASPLGHLVASFAIGPPQGLVLELCVAQLVGGIMLLALRPPRPERP
jgi:hypothetical protein